jgi:hypothetical protein
MKELVPYDMKCSRKIKDCRKEKTKKYKKCIKILNDNKKFHIKKHNQLREIRKYFSENNNNMLSEIKEKVKYIVKDPEYVEQIYNQLYIGYKNKNKKHKAYLSENDIKEINKKYGNSNDIVVKIKNAIHYLNIKKTI